MENSPKAQIQINQNPSPKSTTTTSSTCSSNPTTPRPITRSEPNSPYPTTFVQADTSSFKQIVQMLTGSTKPEPHKNHPIPPIRPSTKKPVSKLYERRNSSKTFKINPLVSGFTSRNEILSPSILDFPSLALSPVTPLIPDPFNRSPVPRTGMNLDLVAEDQAISNKGFFLHPSPGNTPRDSEPPRLLPLFPVSSPRVAGSGV